MRSRRPVARIERHTLGARLYVLGQRVHEWHLGAVVLLTLAVGALTEHVHASFAGILAALTGLWLVAKDWRDLVPSLRDTGSWRVGIHGRSPAPHDARSDGLPLLAARRRRSRSRRQRRLGADARCPCAVTRLLALEPVLVPFACPRARAARRRRARDRRALPPQAPAPRAPAGLGCSSPRRAGRPQGPRRRGGRAQLGRGRPAVVGPRSRSVSGTTRLRGLAALVARPPLWLARGSRGRSPSGERPDGTPRPPAVARETGDLLVWSAGPLPITDDSAGSRSARRARPRRR